VSKQLARTVVSGFNRQPAMLALAYADLLTEAVQNLSAANTKDENDAAQEAKATLLAAYGYHITDTDKPFAYANGIAFIPIHGLLINRFSWSWGWVTGYNFIRNQLVAALDDADVKAIVFDVNSGGGMVAGCFELAAEIRASRDLKPSVAVVDAACYSACYALASSASKIVCTPSGGVGSIGVVAMHVDYSKMFQEAGVKVTFIHSGDHKVDGNPYEPLPASVKADIQKSVDSTRTEFVALVATNKGLDTKVVFDTEARCYTASEGLDLGLIDAIAAPLDAVNAFLNELSDSEATMENDDMSTSAVKPGAERTSTSATATTAVVTQTATAAPAEGATVETKVDAAAERNAERARIKGIQSHAEAADRQTLANHLALNTDMSVEAAAAILAAAPKEKAEAAPAGENAFAAAMNASEHPNVGADTAAGGEKTAAQRILDAQAIATGVKR